MIQNCLLRVLSVCASLLRRQASSEGLRAALDLLRFERHVAYHHARGAARLASLRDPRGLQLHLGCGPVLKPGWINIDMMPADGVYTLDLREPIPLPDGSCAMVYSEHFFEHIGYPHNAELLLRDYLRLLEPGGRVSIGVPDGELGLRAYAGDDPERFFAISKERWHPAWANTRMEQINYLFRQDGEHKFIYDEETLAGLMRRVGFTSIRRRGFDPAIDSASRSWGTLYMDATKPV